MIALAAVLAAPASQAADVLLQAADSSNSRYSFTSASTNWPGSGAATSGNAYFSDGKTIWGGGGNFGGDSLTLNSTLELRANPATANNLGTSLIASGANAKIKLPTSGTTGTLGVYTLSANVGGAISFADTLSVLTLDTGNVNNRLQIQAPIQGVGSVTVLSSGSSGGAVLYERASSYAGNTRIGANGILRMGVENAMPFGAGKGDLIFDASTGRVRLARSSPTATGYNTTINGLSGAGGVENGGTNAVVLTILGGANNNFTGTIANGSTGALAVTKAGTGYQILAGSNTYTGLTTISGGTLEIRHANALGTGTGALGTTISAAGGTLALSGGITSPEAITLVGRADTTSHITNLSGSNALSASPSTLTLTSGGGASDNYNLAVAGGSLTINNNISGAGAGSAAVLNLDAANGTSGTVSGTITMAAGNGLKKTGAGTWTLTGAVSNLGTLNVDAGTLVLGSGITVDGNVTANGTLQLKATNATAKGLTGSGTVTNVGTGTALLTLGASDLVDRTFSGEVTNTAGNALSVTKTGTNRQVLSGTTSYTGTTTISDGQLRFSGANSLSNLTGKVTVAGSNSGTLELSNVGTSSDAVDLVGRSSSTYHVDNIAGDNTLSGVITLAESDPAGSTPDNYNLNVTAGTLNLSSGLSVAAGSDNDPTNLNLSAAVGATGRLGAVTFNATSDNDIVKTGAGTWQLDGATTNVRNIGVQAGTLVFNSAGIAYSGDTTISSGATLKQGASGAVGNGALFVDGALDLGGFNATLHGLNGAATGSVTNSGVAAPAVLTIDGGGNFAGQIGGGTSVIALTLNTANAGDRQVMSGANVYTGQTTISNGTLEIRNGGALGGAGGAGTEIKDAGTLALSGGISSAEALTLSGRAGPGAHVVSESGANTLSAPTLTLTSGGGGFDNYNLAVTGGSLTITSTIDGSGAGAAAALNLDAADTTTGTVSGGIGMGGADSRLKKTGAGTWNLDGAVTGLTNLDVAAGTLALGSSISVAGDINVDGTLDLKGVNATGWGLTGSGTITDALDSTLTFGADGIGVKTYAGTIKDGAGQVSLIKVGNNTQVLGAANTYSGLTTISGGTLQIENGSALGTSVGEDDRTIVEAGGMLAVAGGIATSEQLSLKGRALAAPVAVTSAGDNRLAGVIELEAGADQYFDLESTAGTLTVAGEIAAAAGTGNVSLGLMGPGDTVVDSAINLSQATGEHKVYALGAGTKTLNGAVNLSKATTSGNLRIGNEGGGNLIVNGNAVLTGSGGSASLRNLDSGDLTAKNVDLSGAAGEAYVYNEDNGHLEVTGTLNMSNATGGARIENAGAGSVTIAGANLFKATAGASVLNDTGGSVVVSGALDMRNSGSAVVLNQGDGTMTIADVDMTGSGGVTRVANTGAGGTLTVEGTLAGVDTAGASAGTFKLGAGADISAVSSLTVAAGAIIDATDVVGGFHLASGQTLSGGGLVMGDVTADDGSVLSPGSSPGTLHFDDDLTLLAGSLARIDIDLVGTNDDMLIVDGLLTLTADDIFAFNLSGTTRGGYYAFARYGTLSIVDASSLPSDCAHLGVIPSGFSLVCDYGTLHDQLALYKEPVPSPAPAPVFLMGLGALAMGAARRWTKR